MPDILAAVEWLAKRIRDNAHVFAEYLAEMRTPFSDSEAGDYLAGRMECDGPDAAEVPGCYRGICDTPRACLQLSACLSLQPTASAASPAAADPSPARQTVSEPSMGDDGPAEDCAIPRAPSAGHPTSPSPNLPTPIELLIDGAMAIDMWLRGIQPLYSTRNTWHAKAMHMRTTAAQLYPK